MRAIVRAARAALLVLGVALGAGACREGREAAREESGAAAGGAIDGLSREEIERQVQPMSPERAEQLGIVDTTIHVESLQSPRDSMLVGPDTTRGRRP